MLVPVYNDNAYIDEALASIAQQSISDFEVIIADDCSKDGSLERAENWSGRDERFRVIKNATNIGMTRNWNRWLICQIDRTRA